MVISKKIVLLQIFFLGGVGGGGESPHPPGIYGPEIQQNV